MNRFGWIASVLISLGLVAFVAAVMIIKWDDYPEEKHDEHSLSAPLVASA